MFEVKRNPLYDEIIEKGEKKEDFTLTGYMEDSDIDKYVYDGEVYLVKGENKSVSPIGRMSYFF